jgi:hypothetical protein
VISTQKGREKDLEDANGVTDPTTQVSGRMESDMERESSSPEKEPFTMECFTMTLDMAQEK